MELTKVFVLMHSDDDATWPVAVYGDRAMAEAWAQANDCGDVEEIDFYPAGVGDFPVATTLYSASLLAREGGRHEQIVPMESRHWSVTDPDAPTVSVGKWTWDTLDQPRLGEFPDRPRDAMGRVLMRGRQIFAAGYRSAEECTAAVLAKIAELEAEWAAE